jgi:hypothetical protein
VAFIVKINHNELLTYPNKFDQVMFGSVHDAWELGAVAVGATIYFGSDESTRQIVEVAQAFEEARSLGLATILWCYTRNNAFKKDGVGLQRGGRPDRPGQPPGRYHPGRHHQAETARDQRRLQGPQHEWFELRQDRRTDLHPAYLRPPH